jgi:hypothetical protein
MNSSFQRIPVKWCTQDDFGYDKIDIETFKSWEGFGIICPDFKNKSMFKIYNDGIYMKYSTININFDACNSSKFNDCAD